MVLLGGAGERVACALEMWLRVGRSGGDGGGVLVAFGAEVPVEGPGVIAGGKGLGFGAAHGVEHGLARAAVVGHEAEGMVGLEAGVQVWVGAWPRDWPT
jgi:hypothetical protein